MVLVENPTIPSRGLWQPGNCNIFSGDSIGKNDLRLKHGDLKHYTIPWPNITHTHTIIIFPNVCKCLLNHGLWAVFNITVGGCDILGV